MGASAEYAFSNDDAADWFDELQDADEPVLFLTETLDYQVEEDGYLELPESGGIVAAAAIVAAARGQVPSEFPGYVSEWLHGKESSLQHLASKALAGLERVHGDGSEMRDLWEESEHYAAWCAHLGEIAAGLR